MKTKTWQERFDEMSEIEEFWGLPYDHLVDKAVKQFISDLITKTREETIREVENMINKEFPHQKLYCEAQDLRCEILEELNKLKK